MTEDALEAWIKWWEENKESPIWTGRSLVKAAWEEAWKQGYDKAIEDIKGTL